MPRAAEWMTRPIDVGQTAADRTILNLLEVGSQRANPLGAATADSAFPDQQVKDDTANR